MKLTYEILKAVQSYCLNTLEGNCFECILARDWKTGSSSTCTMVGVLGDFEKPGDWDLKKWIKSNAMKEEE